MAESADFTWKFMDRNSKDLEEMKTKQNVQVVKTPKPVLEAQLKAWDAVVEEKSKGNPFFVKVLEPQRQWAARVVPLRQEIMVDNEPAYQHYFKASADPANKQLSIARARSGSRAASATCSLADAASVLGEGNQVVKKTIKLIDTVSTWIGIPFSWLIIPMMLTTCYDVSARYFFSAPTQWA